MFKGENEIMLNAETVKEAVAEYLNRRLLPHAGDIRVLSYKTNGANGLIEFKITTDPEP